MKYFDAIAAIMFLLIAFPVNGHAHEYQWFGSIKIEVGDSHPITFRRAGTVDAASEPVAKIRAEREFLAFLSQLTSSVKETGGQLQVLKETINVSVAKASSEKSKLGPGKTGAARIDVISFNVNHPNDSTGLGFGFFSDFEDDIQFEIDAQFRPSEGEAYTAPFTDKEVWTGDVSEFVARSMHIKVHEKDAGTHRDMIGALSVSLLLHEGSLTAKWTAKDNTEIVKLIPKARTLPAVLNTYCRLQMKSQDADYDIILRATLSGQNEFPSAQQVQLDQWNRTVRDATGFVLSQSKPGETFEDTYFRLRKPNEYRLLVPVILLGEGVDDALTRIEKDGYLGVLERLSSPMSSREWLLQELKNRNRPVSAKEIENIRPGSILDKIRNMSRR